MINFFKKFNYFIYIGEIDYYILFIKSFNFIFIKRRKYNQFYCELLLKGKLKNVLWEFKKKYLVYLFNLINKMFFDF